MYIYDCNCINTCFCLIYVYLLAAGRQSHISNHARGFATCLWALRRSWRYLHTARSVYTWKSWIRFRSVSNKPHWNSTHTNLPFMEEIEICEVRLDFAYFAYKWIRITHFFVVVFPANAMPDKVCSLATVAYQISASQHTENTTKPFKEL